MNRAFDLPLGTVSASSSSSRETRSKHSWRTRLVVSMLILFSASMVTSGCGDPYPPPLMAGTNTPLIRVRLGGVRTRAALTVPSQSWELRGGNGALDRGHSTFRTTLQSTSKGIALKGRTFPGDFLRIHTSHTFILDGITYEGDLIIRRHGAQLELVNELPLERYLPGVIANEAAPNSSPATYRAQAVTARTYAYIRMNASGAAKKSFHVYDSTNSQVYRGRTIPDYAGVTYRQMEEAVRSNAGVIMTYNGRPFSAYYSSTCGGHTTNAATSRLDPGHGTGALQGVRCTHCKTSPRFSWKKAVSDVDLMAGMKADGRPLSKPIHSIEISKRGRGNWAAELRVVYGPSKRTKLVPGTVFRTVCRLLSHNIRSIKQVKGGWEIIGRGWGHGVGMCQWGAMEMGKKGMTDTEILSFYYPGVAFRRMY